MASNAYFFMTIKIPKNFEQKVLDAVEKKFFEEIRSNVASLAFRVEGIVNQTVHENRNHFIPSDEEAGELGIQAKIGAGQIDEEKRSGAWRTLLIGSPGSAGYVKWEVSQGGDLAKISVGWDKDKLYNNPKSIVNVYDLKKGKRTIIPWMKWFLEGELISGSHFSPITKGHIQNVSRTGLGIMAKGGLWHFPPSQFDLNWLAKEVSKNVSDRLKFLLSRGKASANILTKPRRDV